MVFASRVCHRPLGPKRLVDDEGQSMFHLDQVRLLLVVANRGGTAVGVAG